MFRRLPALRLLAALVLVGSMLVAPVLACAEPPQAQWFTVLLDGRKIGSLQATRVVHGDQVTTRQSLNITLDRAGTPITLSSDETSEETRSGRPLAFTSTSKLSGSDSHVQGHVQGDTMTVRSKDANGVREQTLAWPEGALLPEGLRLAALKAGRATNTQWAALAFQPASLSAIRVDTTIGARETVELPTGSRRLLAIMQQLDYTDTAMRSRAWVDEDQTLYKLVMPMLGVDLTMLACDQPCATAPNQPASVFERTLVTIPGGLDRAELDGARYLLQSRDGRALPDLPQTGEQRVWRDANGLHVDIRRRAVHSAESPPDGADSAANDWLQSDTEEIQALARRATSKDQDDAARMRTLEIFVRGFISDKNLGVGYASALEVARNPQGDCTEHAVLLAALGRALGIPTRVVNGLAYAPGFAGHDHVFVPHAWTQAWVDGSWQSFDAALNGFDAGHLALSIGDGDPWRFYQGIDILGRIDIKAINALPPISHVQSGN